MKAYEHMCMILIFYDLAQTTRDIIHNINLSNKNTEIFSKHRIYLKIHVTI